MLSIAVIGSNGYVGKAIYQELLRSSKYSVVGVTRENYAANKEQSFDIVINCAMPSGRFWAKNHPEEDFTETVKKTADLLYGWKFNKFVQISTVSARCQLDTVYGRHKAAAEKLCGFGDNLIVRLGALYSENMKKGVLVDMLEGKKVFVDESSRYSFISLDFCASWIASNLDRKGLVELGGRNAIALKEVVNHLGADIEFEGEVNHQDIESGGNDLPEASQVLNFLDNLTNQRSI
jgi:nucleoside-diphosphate-sugar epimerase